jgi:polysaccharide export outer membrane protein
VTPRGGEDFAAIGDRIVVHASDEPDLCGGGLVDADGRVSLPRLGSIPVVGLTAGEIEALLSSRQGKLAPKRFLVSIDHDPETFFVFGEVMAPSEQEYSRDLTIYEAVMGSNPKPGSADLKHVRLIRGDELRQTVDLGEMLESGDSTFNIHIRPRDIIFVPVADPSEDH